MPAQNPYSTKTLVQFHLLNKIQESVIRVEPSETVESSIERRLGRSDFPEPNRLLNRQFVRATELIRLLGMSKLELTDARQQVRIGKNGKTHLLVTFEFGGNPVTDKWRRAELIDVGTKTLEVFLQKTWKWANVVSFPNEKDLHSVLFTGPLDMIEAAIVEDVEAARYGFVVLRA